jgi:hypothetical protein
MPSKKNQPAADIGLPDIPKELLDEFVTGPMTAEAVEAVTRKFKKAIIERALVRKCVTIWTMAREKINRTALPTTATAKRQDCPDRRWAVDDRHSARPPRQVRSDPDSQA